MRLTLHRALNAADAPLALAIGNFDGVHLGHRAILAATVTAAQSMGLSPAAMSFHPLPREFFSTADAPPRLMSTTEKLSAFAQCGIAHAYLPKFDRHFAAQSPDAFIERLTAMRVRWLMVGEDFRFGAKRAGDVMRLRDGGRKHGFIVEAMPDISDQGLRISSTAVRDALREARLTQAAAWLGAPYRIVGRVIHGRKLGRTLGFPTANIALSRRKPALGGVFAVRCQLVTRGLEGVASKNGLILDGVANLGTNPVVSSENHPHLEVFLLDFDGDLYGKRVAVQFIEKIRDEQHFSGLDALVARMHHDVAEARTILARITHGSNESKER
jgi:riboflavin kinase/FMN adenylyltransferase